jgi:tetratricopeptide (TPR) repeat protein
MRGLFLIILITGVMGFPSFGHKSAKEYFELGEKQYEKKEYFKAISEYTRAIELDDKYFSAYWKRGLCKVAINSPGVAIKDFDKAIEISPSGELYYERANAKMKLNDKNGACLDYQIACDLMHNRSCDLLRINCK